MSAGRAKQRRRSIKLLQPALQLKLPAYLIAVTSGFAVVWALNAVRAYHLFYEAVAGPHAAYLDPLLEAQTGDFLVVSGLLAVGYVVFVLVAAIVHSHRILGPAVAIRRQLESLKNGDYAVRVRLRRKDALGELARDLNELSELLEEREKRE